MQQSFDPQRFKQALGAFTTGVTIITALDADGTDVGMTANSFNSVSLSPPMVLWSLGRNSSNVDAFMQAKHFAVHVLASDQAELAARFSQRGIDRFAGLELERGQASLPLLTRAAARFECRTAFQYEGGDHVIFVGEVLAFEHWEHEPLVFKRGRFALAVAHAAPAPAPTIDHDFLVYLLGRAYFQLHSKIKPELLRRQLDEPEYFALQVLGVRDGVTALELHALLEYTGTRIDAQVAQKLQKLGLVQLDATQRLHLTDAGRRQVVELLAMARAATLAAEKSLDPSESRALRQLLQRVIDACALP